MGVSLSAETKTKRIVGKLMIFQLTITLKFYS